MSELNSYFLAEHRAFLLRLGRACREVGGRACLVGGCVRSALLGETVHDFDVEVFGLPPEELEPVLGGLAPVIRVGKAFGIYKLQGWPVDVGLPRRERKTSSGHRGFAVDIDPGMSVREAARRRDFTVNAIYCDLATGELEDPLDGRVDLQAGILRHCSERFPEDPLRVLRAMQLAARLSAEVAPETRELCASLTPEGLSRERFFGEWEKLILLGKRPSCGLAFLRQAGWLRFFPPLADLVDCPQDPQWHPEGDVWTHTLHCMDAFARRRTGDREEDLVVGLAVLCHDFGKARTTARVDGRIRSPGHEKAGLEPAQRFMEQLNVSRRIQEAVLPLIHCHMRPSLLYQQSSSASAIRRLARDCGRLDRLLRVAEADAAGRPPMPGNAAHVTDWIRRRARELEVEQQAPAPLITGKDLLERGWESGPAIGEFLRAAYERQLDGLFQDRPEALAWLDRQLEERLRSPGTQASEPEA